MIWGLCLLCAAGGLGAVHAGPLAGAGRTGEVASPQDEVNVLMFGVIQFSESLNYVYETTEAKLAKIRQALRSHEGTLQTLGEQAGRAAEEERQMKEALQLLQDQMAKQRAQARMARDRLAGMEREEEGLKTKVKKLEMHVHAAAPATVKELQARAEEHSSILKGLQLLTQIQKESIETQNERLSKLQKMSDALT